MARVSVRLDRFRQIERHVRDEGCWRALTCWDDDQRVEVERIAAQLTKKPSQVVGWLRRSPHGCDWLIERWAMLASVADQHSWTDEQSGLAYDLMGTPWEVRGDAPTHEIDVQGFGRNSDRPQAEVARAMISDLEAQRDRVIEVDEIAQARAQADCDEFCNRELVRLRRSESDLYRHLRWHHDLLHHESPPAIANQDDHPYPADPVVIATETAETKPPAVVKNARNKAILPGDRLESRPLEDRLPTLAEPRPPLSVPIRSQRLTSYEMWVWQRADADRVLRDPQPGQGACSSVLPISAGKRGLVPREVVGDWEFERDAAIPRQTRKRDRGGSALAEKWLKR